MSGYWAKQKHEVTTGCEIGAYMECLASGVAVFSKRAVPLAAWTSGFELAALVADTDRACVILETGVNQRWRYGSYRRNPETNAEARQWEDAKKLVK